MPSRKPHIYLDTNVILDVIEDRWDPSRDLVAKVVQLNWLCSTSRFTVLEMFTLSQIVRRLGGRRTGKFQLRSRELDEIYADLAASIDVHVSCVTFHAPLDGLWDEAEKLCADTNIAPADAIHLATALGVGCDVLVSRDSDFVGITRRYMPATLPEHIEDALTAAGL